MCLRLSNFDPGEMAEWSIAAVLKTADCQRSGGSNPSLSAKAHQVHSDGLFCYVFYL